MSEPAKTSGSPLLSVRGLRVVFTMPKKHLFSRHQDRLAAVDNVSFEIRPGETLGVVGESGCGSSTHFTS